MTDREYLIRKVKETVLSFDADADVILYGSRTRGSAAPESDWDFLVLTGSEFNNDKKREIRKRIHSIEIETCEVISVIIHSRSYWNSPRNTVTPFYKNIDLESISL
jgi:predicted nucleotidyltransferase